MHELEDGLVADVLHDQGQQLVRKQGQYGNLFIQVRLLFLRRQDLALLADRCFLPLDFRG